MKRAALCTVVLLALSACDDSTAPWVGPHRVGSLRMTASISDARVPVDVTTSIVFQLHNDGADTVKLAPSECRTLAMYLITADGREVFSTDTNMQCLAVAFSTTIPPGEMIADTLRVGGTGYRGLGDWTFLDIAPGQYRAFARLVRPEIRMVSPMVPLVITRN